MSPKIPLNLPGANSCVFLTASFSLWKVRHVKYFFCKIPFLCLLCENTTETKLMFRGWQNNPFVVLSSARVSHVSVKEALNIRRRRGNMIQMFLCVRASAGGDPVPVPGVCGVRPAERSEGHLPHSVWHAGERHRRANTQVEEAARRKKKNATRVFLGTCNHQCVTVKHTLVIYPIRLVPTGSSSNQTMFFLNIKTYMCVIFYISRSTSSKELQFLSFLFFSSLCH